MAWSLSQIAAALDAPVEGDGTLPISGAAEPQLARSDQLALALTPAYGALLAQGAARAALLWPGADWRALGLEGAILAPRGRLAMARLTQTLDPGAAFAPGVHPLALVDPTARLGVGVSVGPYTVIGAGAVLGDQVRIGPQVTVSEGAQIGEGGIVMAGARIGPRVRIGARVIVQFNAVIGSDGFSFVTATLSQAEAARATLGQAAPVIPDDPTWHRIHSLGGVEIGNDVEIGAGSTVDAGTIRPTRIGHGTKLDNLVHVAHNVVLGEHCLLCALVGVAGSTLIGNRVVMGGKSGAGDNLRIGDDVVLGAGTIALSNVPGGRVMLGYPAMPMAAQIESYKALRRLPRILRRLVTGEKPVPNPGESG